MNHAAPPRTTAHRDFDGEWMRKNRAAQAARSVARGLLRRSRDRAPSSPPAPWPVGRGARRLWAPAMRPSKVNGQAEAAGRDPCGRRRCLSVR